MGYKEYTAKTLDEAITMASIDLGVTSTELSYEVTEKGSNGILGLGRKDVTIKAIRISDLPSPDDNEKRERVHKEDYHKEEKREKHDYRAQEDADRDFDDAPADTQKQLSDSEKETVISITKEFLGSVFTDMGIEVEIDTVFHDKDNSLSVDMKGDHMGIIIGKRGQTLDSLQYLVNLVVNKKTDTYIRIKLDTEDYRRRRKETLENLAKNIAFKVKRSGKPVTLEAMNPYERRTIHYALQKDRYVTTYSEGEEPYRHVVVVAK